MKWRNYLLPLAVVCAAACAVARADEIRLKDGSKIIGTIVGFEDGSFKVQTAYGFAMVRKASIVEIVPSDTGKTSDTGKSGDATSADDSKPAESAAPKAPAKPVAAKPATKVPAQSAQASNSAALQLAQNDAKPSSKPVSDAPASAAAATSSTPAMPPPMTPAPAAASPTAVAAVAPKPAPPPAKPVPIEESILGSVYINQTYGFSLYRPPDWQIMADSRSAMPEAITTLGTADHSALLVIGRDTQGGDIDMRAASTEAKLREVYENFRPGLSRHISVAGVPAVEMHFQGSGGGQEWSVTTVTLARGNEVLTILGMTSANSDLIQFQEAILSKVIGSLQFTHPQ